MDERGHCWVSEATLLQCAMQAFVDSLRRPLFHSLAPSSLPPLFSPSLIKLLRRFLGHEIRRPSVRDPCSYDLGRRSSERPRKHEGDRDRAHGFVHDQFGRLNALFSASWSGGHSDSDSDSHAVGDQILSRKSGGEI